MKPTAGADPFILEALENEAETVAGMLDFLNRVDEHGFSWHREWGRLFSQEDVIAALTRLVRDDSVRVLVAPASGEEWIELPARQLPAGRYHDVRFKITSRGFVRYANWEP